MDTLPRAVHIGMNVYDSQHRHIGKIDDLKFPENAGEPDVEPADIDRTDDRHETILGAVAEAFGKEPIPEELRERLLREGYIRIDTAGLFMSDRFVLPGQIASASGDEVVLNVGKDELIKRH